MSRVSLIDEGTPALTVQGLTTWLDGSTGVVRALEGVGFTLLTGKTLAIVGESGCGKSMTALSITRLLPENGRVVAGSVMLGQDDLLGLTESTMRNVRGRHVAMIFQEPATSLNPVLTVGGQIAEVLTRHTTLSSPEARTRAVHMLASVGIADPERCAADYPFRLSGGMKQRVMIALALAAEPTVLIADEPTTALDVTTQAQVLELLREQQARRGMAMVLISHDLGVVSQMADWVAVMYAGEIVELAPRDRFFAAPQHPYSRKLFESVPGPHRRGQPLAVIPGQVPALDGEFIGCRFADRCTEVAPRCRTQAPAWTTIPLTSGHAARVDADAHTVRCHARESSPAPALAIATVASGVVAPRPQAEGAPLLQVRDLTVHFPVRRGLLKRVVGQVRAVDGVSFDIAAGETLALVGESGCGKTTVGKSILQLIRPTRGSVRYRGDELTALSEDALRSRRGDLQIVFQDPFASLNPRMRVAEILTEGMEALGKFDSIDRVDSVDARDDRVAELLDRVGLPRLAGGRYPHEFSGGQRQRIAIARALAVNPRLIVCDEPTSALDVSVQAQILNLLSDLQRDLGVAYLFITHNIGVVEYLAHRVAVMYLGRIVEEGPATAVLTRPSHPYTQALLQAVPRLDAAPRAKASEDLGGTASSSFVRGETPSAFAPPSGCHFHPRCPHADGECAAAYPANVAVPGSVPGHQAACMKLEALAGAR